MLTRPPVPSTVRVPLSGTWDLYGVAVVGPSSIARAALAITAMTSLLCLLASCGDGGVPDVAGPATASEGAGPDVPVPPGPSSGPAPSDAAGVEPDKPGPTVTAPDEPAPAPGPDVAASAPGAGPLERAVQEFVAAQSVPFSVVAVDLVAGAGAYHLADRQVLSASVYKLFVARELLRRVYLGELARTAPMGDEEGRTVEACIRDMLVLSDNDCGVAGLGIVGRGDQDAELRAFGFSSTSLASPQRTSAADVARFLRAARDGTLFGPGGAAASAELYGLLARQAVRDRFPLGLPAATPLAHKTGDRVGWAHDAGIFSTPSGDVLLVALSGPWPPPCCDADRPGPAEVVAFGALADLARVVYAATA